MNENAIPATFRDINTITAEIRTIQGTVRRTALEGAIEIGRRLTEAKELLPHGEWGNWLKTEFEFSQPTASRLMTLFKEYAADQSSLFGAESKYSALNNISVTKALRLIAIPSEEREEWAKEHDVENISTRELDRLIKEKEEVEKARAEAERERAETAELLNKKCDEYTALNEAARELREQADSTDERIEKIKQAAERDKATLEKKLSAAAKAREKAEEQVRQAENAEMQAKAKLEELRKNPEIPPELIAKAAEEKTAAAKEEAEAYKAKVEELNKALSLSCPEAAVFKAWFEQVQLDFNRLMETLEKVRDIQPETAQKFDRAVKALLDSMSGRIRNEN